MKFFVIFLILLSSCNPPTPNRTEKKGEKEEKDTPELNPSPTKLSDLLPSQSFRNRGTALRTYIQELKALQNDTNDVNYRYIPGDFDHDDNITPFSAQLNNCGESDDISKLDQRIEHCALKNPGSYLWRGKTNGIAGEGDWRLVLKNNEITIMQDMRTSLLWTSAIAETNWPNATGRSELATDHICTTATIKFLNQKQVHWRLPTRSEFLQADINGSRFVLQDRARNYWTANSYDEDQAWVIYLQTGALNLMDKTEDIAVRCIGYPLQ